MRMRAYTAGVLAAAILLFGLTSASFAQDEAVALFNKAQDLHEKNDLAGAIDLYSKAIESLPEFPEAEYQRASAYLSLGKRVEAEKGFRRALELREDWTLAQAALGTFLVSEKKFAEAEPLLAKAIAADANNSSAILALADLRLQMRASSALLQDVLTQLTRLSSTPNATANIWSAKAAVESALKKPADARASLGRGLQLEASNRSLLVQSASFLLAEGDIDRARGIVRDLESKEVKGSDVTVLKARLLAADGDLNEAAKLLDQISGPNEDVAELRKQISANSSSSIADLEKQIATDPRDLAALGRLCALYRRVDPAKALDYCKRANEIEPSNPQHAIGFAAALVQAKQYDAAIKLLQRIKEIVADNWTARANLGTALFQSGRYAEAKGEFEWLISKQPSAPAPYLFLALTHDRLREYVDAVANYQAFLKYADPVENKFDIETVKLRLPALEKELKKLKQK